jgi:branched-chain amino acid transport system substrate-binding protein
MPQGKRAHTLRRSILVTAVALGLAAATSACSSSGSSSSSNTSNGSNAASKSPILIGVMMPLTGALGAFAATELPSIKLAVSQINAAGGVLGRKITIDTADTMGTSTGAVAAWDLLASKKPAAIVGPILTPEVAPLVRLADADQIPLLHAAVTQSLDAHRQGSPWFFRITPTDADTYIAMVQYAVSSLHFKRPAIITSSDELGQSFQTEITQDLSQYGLKPVIVKSAPTNATDYTAQILAVKSADPDVVFLSANAPPVATYLKQAAQLGLHVPVVVGTSAVYALDYFNLVPLSDFPPGSITSNSAFPTDDPENPGAAVFVKELTAAAGKTADSYAANWYSVMFMLANAISKAGSASPAAIAQALKSTKDFQSWHGIRMPFPAFTCNSQQDCDDNVLIMGSVNGHLQVLRSINESGS